MQFCWVGPGSRDKRKDCAHLLLSILPVKFQDLVQTTEMTEDFPDIIHFLMIKEVQTAWNY